MHRSRSNSICNVAVRFQTPHLSINHITHNNHWHPKDISLHEIEFEWQMNIQPYRAIKPFIDKYIAIDMQRRTKYFFNKIQEIKKASGCLVDRIAYQHNFGIIL